MVAGVEAGAIHDVLKEQLSLSQQQQQQPTAPPLVARRTEGMTFVLQTESQC
jgi:hypothetical protein